MAISASEQRSFSSHHLQCPTVLRIVMQFGLRDDLRHLVESHLNLSNYSLKDITRNFLERPTN